VARKIKILLFRFIDDRTYSSITFLLKKKDIIANIYTWISIFGITLPYIIIITPRVFIYSSPILPILNGLFFVATVSFLLLTSFTDPGIIPRKGILELEDSIPEHLKLPPHL
jgi:hypothetical protein